MKEFRASLVVLIFVLYLSFVCFGEQELEAITNSVGMKMILLPAGEFTMGSVPGESGRAHDEFAHEVVISKPFYIASTEVTQKQWKEVMGFENCNFKGDNLPVEKVSWKQAMEFCKKLSEKEGKIYSLPSEAQWEYACRAGAKESFGGVGNLDEMGWYFDNSSKATHLVGNKKANSWGLYDMHGNVAEWCLDDYQSDYPADKVTDPVVTDDGKYKVFRGGAWSHFNRAARCAARSCAPVSYQLKYVGLRVIIQSE